MQYTIRTRAWEPYGYSICVDTTSDRSDPLAPSRTSYTVYRYNEAIKTFQIEADAILLIIDLITLKI
jgi:hypothetical protein